MCYETGELKIKLMTTTCPEMKDYIINHHEDDNGEFTEYRFENGYGMSVFKANKDDYHMDRVEGVPIMFLEDDSDRRVSVFDNEFDEYVLTMTSPKSLLKKLKTVKNWTKGQYLR